MKKLISMGLAAFVFSCSPAHAETRLGAGQAGGGYDALMQKIKISMAKKSHSASVLNLSGSEDIYDGLCSGDLDVGVSQRDVALSMGCAGVSPVVVAKTEYALIAFPPRSRNNELSDLDEDDYIVAGDFGSGTAYSFQKMIEIEKEHGNGSSWIKASIVDEPVSKAISFNQLDNRSSGQAADAVFFVTTLDSPFFDQLKSAGWKLGELWDKDINDLKINGESLYEGEKVRTPIGKDYAYKIPSIVFAQDEWSAQYPRMETLISRTANR